MAGRSSCQCETHARVHVQRTDGRQRWRTARHSARNPFFDGVQTNQTILLVLLDSGRVTISPVLLAHGGKRDYMSPVANELWSRGVGVRQRHYQVRPRVLYVCTKGLFSLCS
ncbi:hypothetical protein PAHAL_3G479000 [Panicum hallii]|uniref:Uncharacterized protein n=1 Tax=Panicum hallii TaxID=206008 RepID=A0A2T8KLR4_9POAL|nr:hypothetical protein PAHAL_3G479000 [Panicum hallii]